MYITHTPPSHKFMYIHSHHNTQPNIYTYIHRYTHRHTYTHGHTYTHTHTLGVTDLVADGLSVLGVITG